MKFYRVSLITTVILLNTNLQAAHNFEIVNGNPQIPIHVQANGGPWQLLDQKHYRYPVNVLENNLLLMILSANEDKSAPTTIIFTPEKAREIAKQLGTKTTGTPNFYVTANVVLEKIPGTNRTIKRIQLTPQPSNGLSNKTKFGLLLDNNMTQQMIDAMVTFAATEKHETTKAKEVVSATVMTKVTQLPTKKPRETAKQEGPYKKANQ